MSTPHARKKRAHTKSKTGCNTCKKRRVKCDQKNFPTCENCSKRGIECDWPQIFLDQHVCRRPATQPIFTLGLSVYDLELIHHFTTTTAVSLVDIHGIKSPHVLGIYQRNAPRLALAHPFLMHSILAISALHLHWLNRKGSASIASRYYTLSCHHRTHSVLKYNPSQCPQTHCSPQCTCHGLSDAQFLTNLMLSLYAICDSMLGIPDYVQSEVRAMHWSGNGWGGDRYMLDGPASSTSSQGQEPSVYLPLNIPKTILSNPTGISLSPALYSLHIPYSGAPDDIELL
ncbi:hypothetical protein DL96DRAFT_1618047 [Flagelloscypha sp. PMI_526]|nr:hypothetical protein DL96DRAFT_1618047 [Flagelloscypha sp. PMI_526]